MTEPMAVADIDNRRHQPHHRRTSFSYSTFHSQTSTSYHGDCFDHENAPASYLELLVPDADPLPVSKTVRREEVAPRLDSVVMAAEGVPVTDAQIAERLSTTTFLPGLYTATTVNLKSGSITDVAALAQFPTLHAVDLSANRIASLRALAPLEQLRSLHASHNLLVTFPEFGDGADRDAFPRLLADLDLSHNQIATIGPDMARLRYLTCLNLKANALTSLTWCRSLPSLQTLNVSDNRISALDGIEGAVYLTGLDIASNSLMSLAVPATKPLLRYLDAAGNQIVDVVGIADRFPMLATLNLAENAIVSIEALADLAGLGLLRDLILTGNQVRQAERYRDELVFRLPDLECLDGDRLTSLEVLQSEISHGEHAAVFAPEASAQCAVQRRSATRT